MIMHGAVGSYMVRRPANSILNLNLNLNLHDSEPGGSRTHSIRTQRRNHCTTSYTYIRITDIRLIGFKHQSYRFKVFVTLQHPNRGPTCTVKFVDGVITLLRLNTH